MSDWLIPAALLVLVMLAVHVASRAITSATGRTAATQGLWGLAMAIGTGATAAIVSLVWDPPLHWVAFSAGLASGTLSILAQLFRGRGAA